MWNRKLGRKADHRKALLRNMATSVIAYGQIETTEMKAKELRSVVDELITLAKRGDLHAYRNCLMKSDLHTKIVTEDILELLRLEFAVVTQLQWQSLN